MLNRFHLIPERYVQTDRRTDGQTDRFAISISRVSMLTRNKNYKRRSDLKNVWRHTDRHTDTQTDRQHRHKYRPSSCWGVYCAAFHWLYSTEFCTVTLRLQLRTKRLWHTHTWTTSVHWALTAVIIINTRKLSKHGRPQELLQSPILPFLSLPSLFFPFLSAPLPFLSFPSLPFLPSPLCRPLPAAPSPTCREA